MLPLRPLVTDKELSEAKHRTPIPERAIKVKAPAKNMAGKLSKADLRARGWTYGRAMHPPARKNAADDTFIYWRPGVDRNNARHCKLAVHGVHYFRTKEETDAFITQHWDDQDFIDVVIVFPPDVPVHGLAAKSKKSKGARVVSAPSSSGAASSSSSLSSSSQRHDVMMMMAGGNLGHSATEEHMEDHDEADDSMQASGGEEGAQRRHVVKKRASPSSTTPQVKNKKNTMKVALPSSTPQQQKRKTAMKTPLPLSTAQKQQKTALKTPLPPSTAQQQQQQKRSKKATTTASASGARELDESLQAAAAALASMQMQQSGKPSASSSSSSSHARGGSDSAPLCTVKSGTSLPGSPATSTVRSLITKKPGGVTKKPEAEKRLKKSEVVAKAEQITYIKGAARRVKVKVGTGSVDNTGGGGGQVVRRQSLVLPVRRALRQAPGVLRKVLSHGCDAVMSSPRRLLRLVTIGTQPV